MQEGIEDKKIVLSYHDILSAIEETNEIVNKVEISLWREGKGGNKGIHNVKL